MTKDKTIKKIDLLKVVNAVDESKKNVDDVLSEILANLKTNEYLKTNGKEIVKTKGEVKQGAD